jgi:AAA+ ATPase superfamily predicted ATPase
MKNPFEYGGVVGGSAFCNRKKELSDLVRAMENSEKLFLYSERRLGKTSLIHYVQSKLPKDKYASAYGKTARSSSCIPSVDWERPR